MSRLPVLLAVLALPALAGCARTSIEERFAAARDHEFGASYVVLADARVHAEVARVGARVAAASGHDPDGFTFRVLNRPEANAFATADGFVYVNTGLLDVLRDEDELAAILAHEVAHLNASHSLDQTRDAQTTAAWGEVGGVALGTAFSVGMAALTAMGATVNDEGQGPVEMVQEAWRHGYTLSTRAADWSLETDRRDDEMEADERATELLTNAGYDSDALIDALVRLRANTRHRERMQSESASCLIGPAAVLEARIQRLQRLVTWGRDWGRDGGRGR